MQSYNYILFKILMIIFSRSIFKRDTHGRYHIRIELALPTTKEIIQGGKIKQLSLIMDTNKIFAKSNINNTRIK